MPGISWSVKWIDFQNSRMQSIVVVSFLSMLWHLACLPEVIGLIDTWLQKSRHAIGNYRICRASFNVAPSQLQLLAWHNCIMNCICASWCLAGDRQGKFLKLRIMPAWLRHMHCVSFLLDLTSSSQCAQQSQNYALMEWVTLELVGAGPLNFEPWAALATRCR